MTLRAAIQLSQQNDHSLKARSYETEAANHNLEVTKYIKLPSIDASYQVNLATANNLTGLFYPAG
ncbi:MAG TPA: TolC family protein, partial [Flavisolibacter sp.]